MFYYLVCYDTSEFHCTLQRDIFYQYFQEKK